MSGLDRAALDRWITSPRYEEAAETAYCHNRDCPAYGEPQDVGTYREYGLWYWQPEECPSCNGDWSEHPPEEDDDDE